MIKMKEKTAVSDRVEFLGKSPRADVLYRAMSKCLGGDLDGYDVLVLTYDGDRETGILSVKWADEYASVDAYAPGFRPGRKIIKRFFGFVFARRNVCLCVVRAGNGVSADFVRRIGFETVGIFDGETLYRLTKDDFAGRFLRKRGHA